MSSLCKQYYHMLSSMFPMLPILLIFHILLNLKQNHSWPSSQCYRYYWYSIYLLIWNKLIQGQVPNVTDITEIPYAFQYERNKWTKAISLNYYNSTLCFEKKDFFKIPALYLAISNWFSCFLRNNVGRLQNGVGQQWTVWATYKRLAGGQNNCWSK